MSADLLYVTNHCSEQPFMGEEVGVGSVRSHGCTSCRGQADESSSTSRGGGGTRRGG
jgi:hypothetical protein